MLLVLLFAHAAARPTVALCFFGLPRSFNTTLPSILQRLVEPLRAMTSLSLFVHTYNVSSVTNQRSGEYNAPIRVADVRQLAPDMLEIADERDVLHALPANFCRRHGDPWQNGYRSFQNYMCQLHSLRRLSDFVLGARAASFDFVLFARLDVYYFTALDVVQLLRAADGTVYVPHVHNFGGVNDRFAFGRRDPMMLYGTRQMSISTYCDSFEAHAEKYLLWFLQRNRVAIRRTPMLFGRVRASGELWEVPVWQLDRAKNATSVADAEDMH